MMRWRGLAATLAIAALAAFFRLHRLDAVPPGFFGDEASDALVAAEVARAEHFPIYVEEETKWGSREPLFHYWTALVMSVSGIDVRSVRLSSALAGTATVVAFHVLCRQWLGARTAFVAAALLAVSRWHVTMSRVGLRPILAPLWIVLTLLALTWLIERPNRQRGRLLGVTVGAGLYTYPAYWIVPPLLAVLMLWRMRHRRRISRRLWRRVAGSAALAAAITAAPLIGYAIVKPEHYFGRAARTLEEGVRAPDAPLRDNMLKVLLMLHIRGDENPRHNLPGRPMLDAVTGGLFVIGVWHVLRRLHRRFSIVRMSLIVLWLAPLLPSVFTDSAPHAPRAAGAMLAVAVLSAFGLARVERWIVPRRRPVWGVATTAVVLAAVALLNYRAYFDQWAKSPAVAAAFNTDLLRFYAEVSGLAEKNDVYASATIAEAPQVRFLNLVRRLPLRHLDGESALLADPASPRDRVLVSDSTLFNQIVLDLYPDCDTVARYSSEGESNGRVFRIERGKLRDALPAGYAEAARRALAPRPGPAPAGPEIQ